LILSYFYLILLHKIIQIMSLENKAQEHKDFIIKSLLYGKPFNKICLYLNVHRETFKKRCLENEYIAPYLCKKAKKQALKDLRNGI